LSTSLLSVNKKKKKEQQLMLILVFGGVVAVAVLTSLISVVGFPIMDSKSLSQSNSVAICGANALKYEQLGYYTGGAAQFNAVMAACPGGSSST
jgi:hypothetical protein